MSEEAQDQPLPCAPRAAEVEPVGQGNRRIAIVGFGGAGGCAAIEAADAGAQVTLFELASEGGGSTAMSSAEIYMGGSRRHPGAAAPAVSRTATEDMFTYMMMSAGPQADEAKDSQLLRKQPASTLNWLVPIHLGVFRSRTAFTKERAIMCLTDDGLLYTGSEKAYPFSRTRQAGSARGHNLYIEGDNGGPLFMKIVTENVDTGARQYTVSSMKPGCPVASSSTTIMKSLAWLSARTSRNFNVRAQQGVSYFAPAAFIMNDEMLAKPRSQSCCSGNNAIGNPGDTGTGIMMGMSVGAAAINMHEGFISIPYYPPASITGGIVVNDKGPAFHQ